VKLISSQGVLGGGNTDPTQSRSITRSLQIDSEPLSEFTLARFVSWWYTPLVAQRTVLMSDASTLRHRPLAYERSSANIVSKARKKMDNSFRYEVIIYWSDADEAFIAEVPELPGCAADGATYQEALARLEMVSREWIETALELGREIPEP
jgi:predicted RNase H-like HicB family nuclease